MIVQTVGGIELADVEVKEVKTYKAELLVGTAPYSNIKVYIEGTSAEIIAANDKLLKHYNPKV